MQMSLSSVTTMTASWIPQLRVRWQEEVPEINQNSCYDYLGKLKEQDANREWRSSLVAKWWKEPSADDELDQGNVFKMG